jgi:hypothetical protein
MRGELAAKSRLQGGSGKVGPHPASLRSDIERMTANGITPVITDVRFENEAAFVRNLGGTLIHVVNPETVSRTDAHASENGVAFVDGDILFTNDKTAGLQPIKDFASRLIRP